MANVTELLSEKNLGYGMTEEYASRFDFAEFNIKEEDRWQLEQKEHKLSNSQRQVTIGLYEIAKNLYEAQQILSNYGNGSFRKWFTLLGFSKDYVYRSISRYELCLELENRKAIDLPVRVVTELKKSDFDKETKIAVLNSEQPLVTVHKIKEEIKNKGRTEREKIEEKIEYHQDLKLKYKKLAKKQDEEIEKLKKELENL